MATGDLTTLANVKAWLFGVDPAGFAATQKAISAIAQAANAQVTAAGHNFVTGQQVLLSSIGGMTALSGQTVTVTVVDANNFTIGLNTTSYPAYSGGGVASAEDVIVARLISAASAFAQTYMSRTIGQAAYSELWDGNGRTKMIFPNFPATAVASLVIDGVTIFQAPPAPSAPGVGWVIADKGFSLALLGYAFNKGAQNVAVTYTAGYAATPLDLEQAVIELVGMRYKERTRIGVVSQSLAGQVVAAFTQKDMTDDIRGSFDRYKKVAFV